MLREMTCFICGAVARRIHDTCVACRWHKCPACDACLCKLSPEEQRVAHAVFDTGARTIEPLADALRHIAETSADEDDAALKFQGVAAFALRLAGMGV